MKNKTKYVQFGLTCISVVIASILCIFVIFRFRVIKDAFKDIVGILMPFIYGAVIAYLLSPVCNSLEKSFTKLLDHPKTKKIKKMAGGLAIAVSLVGALLIAWVLLLMVVPQVCRSIIGIVNELPDQLNETNKWLHNLLKSQPDLQVYWDSLATQAIDKLETWIQQDLVPTAQSILTGLGKQMAGVLTAIKNLLIGIIVSVYLLSGRNRFQRQGRIFLRAVFPKKWAERILDEIHYADKMFSGFLTGKLTDSAIIGCICFIVTSLMHMPSALLISVVVGVTNIIPFFGPFIGAVPCAVLLLLESPVQCLYFLIFIVILQQVDGNIIGPKILGNSTGLSSFWVLFSILLFGGMWGFVGMLIGVPLFAVIYDLIRKVVIYLLKKRGNEGLMETLDEPAVAENPAADKGRKQDNL